jgi:filamentous hemagglutinin
MKAVNQLGSWSGSGTALAGHGFRSPGAGTLFVPEGTAITVPRDGIRILDTTGQLIERGDWDALASAARRNPRIANDIEGMTTWLPGAEVPNYTLAAPSGQGGLTIYKNSTTVEFKTPLSDLLDQDMGCVQWAACTEFRVR